MNTIIKNAYLLICLMTIGLIANAQEPYKPLSYLVDGRASGLDNVMNKEGFQNVKTQKSNLDSYTYWWNNRNKKCLIVRTSGGIIKSIVSTGALDCDKDPIENSSSNYRDDTEKQAYLKGYNHGKSNQRKENLYSSNIQINAYNKGYNDGSDGKPINSYYSGGNETSSNRGDAKWRDLNGWVATSAYDVLQQRGFKEIKEHKEGGKTYRVWYRNRSRQCIKTLSVNKKIKEISESNRCN